MSSADNVDLDRVQPDDETCRRMGFDPANPPVRRGPFVPVPGILKTEGPFSPPLTWFEFRGRSGVVNTGPKAGRPWPSNVKRTLKLNAQLLPTTWLEDEY